MIIFLNKVVSFGTLSGDTLVIKNPEFNMINNKLFITGQIPKNSTTNNWAKGKECGVLWDSITEYIIFNSEEEYALLIDKS